MSLAWFNTRGQQIVNSSAVAVDVAVMKCDMLAVQLAKAGRRPDL